MMKRRLIPLVLVVLLLTPALALALSEETFKVDTTADLVGLCSAPVSNPLHKGAHNFCLGFLEGAYHYHVVANMGPSGRRLVCLPDSAPRRDAVASRFVEWAGQHPEYLSEEPVDSWFRFLIETYPCPE
ncbi:MAG: hypothetical protein EOM25_06485 [Deltaproteobacteria bacterium]|nr:hypothetical protein [Deltaproteobacteria bacterium]